MAGKKKKKKSLLLILLVLLLVALGGVYAGVTIYQKQQAEKEAVKLFAAVVAFPASLIIAAIGVFIMRCGNNNIQNFTDGRAYLKQNGFYLTEDKSIFAGTHTSRVPIPKDDDHGSSRGGGSWGGSSSTFSRGGRSFGGGGGKF